MNNKYESKSKVQQILEMPVNVDAIKSTGRVTPSRIAGSSFCLYVMQWNYIQVLRIDYMTLILNFLVRRRVKYDKRVFEMVL